MRWNLTCLLCGLQGTDLVEMQEHAMANHFVKRDQFWHQKREPQNLDAVEFTFTLPDGREWLKARRAE